MTKDSQKKPADRRAEIIEKTYRSAIERGDLEEIERLDAMTSPPIKPKATDRRG
jgi:hypothetical protein